MPYRKMMKRHILLRISAGSAERAMGDDLRRAGWGVRRDGDIDLAAGDARSRAAVKATAMVSRGRGQAVTRRPEERTFAKQAEYWKNVCSISYCVRHR